MTDPLRMRKHLVADIPMPAWPDGARLLPLPDVDAEALHAILANAYVNGFGSVPPFDQWWPALAADSEFDPDLVFVAAADAAWPIGIAQCWASGFVKDIAVVPEWRRRGIGQLLLLEAFHAFRRRGLAHVDLKVVPANGPARALYRRMGMVEAPL